MELSGGLRVPARSREAVMAAAWGWELDLGEWDACKCE